MPKMTKVENRGLSSHHHLQVTRRKGKGKQDPRIRVKCSCCNQAVEIYHPNNPTGKPGLDTLAINGVLGTVDQWRQVLLPLLGMEVPKD